MAQKDVILDHVVEFENSIRARKLRESLGKLWRLDPIQTDSRGKVISSDRGRLSSSANPFCHRCLLDSKGLRECNDVAREITKKLKLREEAENFVFTNCHSGFLYAGCAIRDEDDFLGAFLLGGFLLEEPDEELCRIFDSRTLNFHGVQIKSLGEANKQIPVLGAGELKSAVQILQFIADEFLLFFRNRKPISGVEDQSLVRNSFMGMVGASASMRKLYALVDKLRESESTVLIEGENGTGKEMVAKAIHETSPRAHRRFITANCSAFNENLLDSEFFGHVRGSFTGAVRDKKGLFEVADGGTFFLDEIGEMAPTLQVKLLRVLQEGTFTPVGGTTKKQVNVRIIAATNRNLKEMVEKGGYREDLYYRINVINLPVPPLRDRLEDLPFLVQHFLRKYGPGIGRDSKILSKDSMDALLGYDWPGNVRQLENEVQRAIVLSGRSSEIDSHHLSPTIRSASAHITSVRLGGKLKSTLERIERQILLDGLKRHQGNKSRLSRELGVSRATLIAKVQKYDLDRRYQA